MPPVSIDMRVIARLVGEAGVSAVLLIVAIFLMYSKLPDWMKFVFLVPTVGAPTFLVVAAGVRYILGGASELEITKDRIALSGLRFTDLSDTIKRGFEFLQPRPRPLAQPSGVITGNPADPKSVVADPEAGRLPLTIEVGDVVVPADAASVAPASSEARPASP